MELELEPGLVAALEARTEGWAAGLQLAALSARAHDGVADAYDRIADRWLASRTGFTPSLRRHLGDLVRGLPRGADVLDVGCGSGIPVARHLADRGLRVTGIDASARLLEHARRKVPTATFVHGDMRTVDLDQRFDAIVAWDSVFHVPRLDHAHVFGRFRGWLGRRGRLLLSLGGSAGEGTSEMFGETFFYSGVAPDAALRQLARAGFRIVEAEIDDPSSGGHLAIVAVAT